MLPNRTMEQSDLLLGPMRAAMESLISVAEHVLGVGGRFSSWVGTLDDAHYGTTELNKGPDYKPFTGWPYDEDIPWFTLWEYCWTLSNLREWAGSRKLRVLSLGGNACLLDLALMLDGHCVTLVEQRGIAVEQQERNVGVLGLKRLFRPCLGKMESILPDMIVMHNAMTSTNVLFLAGEAAQRSVSTELGRIIRPKGRAFFTFDFLNPNPSRCVSDPIAHFKWCGFRPWPESRFVDTGSRHHLFYPEPSKGQYTAGGLIQERL